MTPEQKKAIALAKAKVKLAAQGNENPPARGIGQIVYDNLVGDPTDGVQSYGEALGTWLNRAGETATLGVVGDEASAAAYAALPGRAYESELARMRANEEGMSTVGRLSADLTGAVLPAMAGVGVVSGAASLPAAIGRGALMGAGAGATQGLMEGEGGAENRFENAAFGGVSGGLIGGVVPVVARAGGAAVRHFKDWRAVNRAATGIADDLGISRQAARLASDAIGADDATQMAANIRAAGPDAMLADAGPSVQGALDAALQRPGAAARTGMGRIEDRAARSLTRINGTLDDLLGAPQGAETTKTAIRTGTQAARGTSYQTAYSAPIDYASDSGRALEGLLPRVPAKAIRDANLLMQLDGDTSRQIMASIADDGSVTFTRMPDVRQWDYIKRALDHAASTGEGQGALGGQTAMGRAYVGLSRQIRDTLRDAVPAYGEALETSAEAIKRVQGVEAGYTLLRPSTTREAARDALNGLTGPEKAAVKQGVRDYIDDALANVRAVVSDPNLDAREARKALGELNSRAARIKMRMLLGSDADRLFSALDEAGHALGLRAGVAQNSKTAGRLAHNERVAELTEPGAVRNALSGRPVRATQAALGVAAGTTPQAVARSSDRINAELVDLLTRPGQPQALNALARIGFHAGQNLPVPASGAGTEYGLNLLGFSGVPAAVNTLASP